MLFEHLHETDQVPVTDPLEFTNRVVPTLGSRPGSRDAFPGGCQVPVMYAVMITAHRALSIRRRDSSSSGKNER